MALNDDGVGYYYHSLNDWVAGSGELVDAIEYTQYGGTQNWRSIQPDPHNGSSMVWEATRKPYLTGEDDNVGWALNIVDETYYNYRHTLRMSVWLKKTVAESGEISFRQTGTGIYVDGRRRRAYVNSLVPLDGSDVTIPDAAYLQIGTLSDSVFPPNQWFLCVNHVYPYGTDFGDADYKHPDSGIYYPDGTKLSLTGITHWDTTHKTQTYEEFDLRTVTTTAYVTGSGTPSVQSYHPRLDALGYTSAPRIDWLLKNRRPTVISTNLGKLMA